MSRYSDQIRNAGLTETYWDNWADEQREKNITAYTKDDEQCILSSYSRLSIKELAQELNMTERTIKHILKINNIPL